MKKDAKTPTGQKIDGMYENLPYEGPPLNLKNNDPASMRPRLHAECKVYVLRMDDPKDRRTYEQIGDEMGLGWCQVSQEDRQWLPQKETWMIFLRIMHMKYIEPEDMSRAQKSD